MSNSQQRPPGQGFGGPYDKPTFFLATWGKRVLAQLLDSAIVAAGAALAGLAGLVMYQTSEWAMWVVLVTGGVVLLAFGLWQRWVEGETGQTIGKRIVGIELVRQRDAQHLGGPLAIARNYLHVVDSFCGIGLLWPLWDSKRQTFADMIMKTVVVQRKR